MRIVTVWCADWPVLAADVPPEQPAAVFAANRVVARTAAAAEAGVKIGERRRLAQRACPQLTVLKHDPDRDARRFEPVVRAVAEMAPRLEVVEPGWLCLAAKGPSRYFGGDQALAERLVDLVIDTVGVAAEFQVGVGVADGRSVSAIAARLGSRRPVGALVIEPGTSPDFIAPLPIAWLRQLGEVSPELIELFVRLGLRRCGDLGELDRSEVVARFGAEGWHAHRLATADDARPAVVADPPADRSVVHDFDEPIERMETVVFVAKRLADQMVASLGADGRVCTRLVISLATDSGEQSERVWYRDRGLTSPAMVERVRWQLDGWASGGLTSGVVRLELVPDEVRSDEGTQDSFWGGRSRADGDAARAITRLSGLAGERAVRVPEWVGGRLPAERYRWVAAAEVDLETPGDRLDRGDEPWPGATDAPAPAIVYDQPVPIELLDERSRPVGVSGRGMVTAAPAVMIGERGVERVTAWAGPWPLDQRWWDAERARRIARMQVVLAGGEAHLVAVERGIWAILGTYG